MYWFVGENKRANVEGVEAEQSRSTPRSRGLPQSLLGRISLLVFVAAVVVTVILV